MCLTIPGKILEIKKNQALVDFNGEEREVDCRLVMVKRGDYIISQNNTAVRKIKKKDAEYVLNLLNNSEKFIK